mgnify:CR=1 FL=1
MFADCKYSPCASTLLRNYNILSAFRIQFIDKDKNILLIND